MANKNSVANRFDAVILGGGAAGLMCAMTAAKRGKQILLVELSNKIGKKILMSGGGRCNFTNLDVSADNFICHNPHFVKSALSQYTHWDFIALVNKHNIPYHEKTLGQLFCDRSAKDILAMLWSECENAGVELLLNSELKNIERNVDYSMSVNGKTILADNVVVATGGLSIPTLGGASGYGYQIAEQFNLQVNPTTAALVPFTLSGKWKEFSTTLSGVSVPVLVSVPGTNFSENLLFTHRGLSGPAMLQLSSYWNLGQEITINLLPDHDLKTLLGNLKRTQPKSTVSSVMADLLPKSLVQGLYPLWWRRDHERERNLQEYRDSELLELASLFHCWQITPSGTEGYRTAEVTKGGVDVGAISSKTMQATGVEGLYFIGEVLDVTGHLGGFNFQWAWSSGYVAGMQI